MHTLTGVACLESALWNLVNGRRGTKHRPKAATGPASGGASGSRETDTVSNSSAVIAFWHGFESGLRR